MAGCLAGLGASKQSGRPASLVQLIELLLSINKLLTYLFRIIQIRLIDYSIIRLDVLSSPELSSETARTEVSTNFIFNIRIGPCFQQEVHGFILSILGCPMQRYSTSEKSRSDAHLLPPRWWGVWHAHRMISNKSGGPQFADSYLSFFHVTIAKDFT